MNMAKVILKDLKKVYPNTEKKKKVKKGEEPEKKHNLQITEEGVVAVQQFSLEIADKEFIVLVGPSGCGKSTTLRMIAGLEDITSGELWIGDRLMNDVEPKDRDIAMVFQNYALYPHMTVYENMAFSLKLKKVPKDEIKRRVTEMLALVQMSGYEKRKPDALSGGQKQRVAIARALINNPRVLLLDEPLGALDLKLRKQMQIELKRLQKKLGITFVYVTHDQEEAMTMSDRIAVMRDGVILQMDAPAKIYDRPNCRFVADFIGESNVISGVVRSVEGEKLSVETPDGMILACGEGFTVGEKICVSVRSEYLNLSATPVEGFTLRGKVKDFIYVGTVIKTAVELKDDQEIKQSRFELDGTLREGADVYAWWEPHHGVAIHDASEAEVQS